MNDQQMSVQECLSRQADRCANDARSALSAQPLARGYEHFVELDFATIRAGDPAARWLDYCPVYAFAYLVRQAAHDSESLIDAAEQQRALWEALRGRSPVPWREVREIVVAAWRYLSSSRTSPTRHWQMPSRRPRIGTNAGNVQA